MTANHQNRSATASRLLERGPVNGRSTEGRFLRASKAEFVAHVGGAPATAQLLLIDRIGFLRLRLSKLDERMVHAGDLSIDDAKTYLGWTNALSRTIRQLGVRGAPARVESFAERLAKQPVPPSTAPAPAA